MPEELLAQTFIQGSLAVKSQRREKQLIDTRGLQPLEAALTECPQGKES